MVSKLCVFNALSETIWVHFSGQDWFKSFSSGFVQTFAALHSNFEIVSVLKSAFFLQSRQKARRGQREIVWDLDSTIKATLAVPRVSLSGLMPFGPALHSRCQVLSVKQP
jgi:hypothetical protein